MPPYLAKGVEEQLHPRINWYRGKLHATINWGGGRWWGTLPDTTTTQVGCKATTPVVYNAVIGLRPFNNFAGRQD